jgi:hypothetical protein
MLTRTTLFLFFTLAACGPTSPPDVSDGGSVETSDAGRETGPLRFADASMPEASAKNDASCDSTDMMIILDRSESMTSLVGNSGTRIDLAIGAINYITAPPTDQSVRFALQVLPQIGGATCSTELAVPMKIGNGNAIASTLSSMSPQVDYGTPIGVALQSVDGTLAQNKVSGHTQSVVLITDGGECCNCGTNDADVAAVQKLYGEGIETFVVGFGGDDDPVLLNDLACAGHTATNFATSCTCTNGACVASSSIDAQTTQVYFKASDGVALKSALVTITNQTCCGCNVPN